MAVLKDWGAVEVASYLEAPETVARAKLGGDVAARACELVLAVLGSGWVEEPASKPVYDAVLLAGIVAGDAVLLRRLQAALVEAVVDEGLSGPMEEVVALFGPPFLRTFEADEAGLSVAFQEYVGLGLRGVAAFQCQDLRGGRVRLDYGSLRALLVYRMLAEHGASIQRVPPSRIPEGLEGAVEQLRAASRSRNLALEEGESQGLIPECFPPCIRAYMASIGSGDVLGHHERFNLVAFLNTLGASSEQIVDVFRASSGFSEAQTKYQVSHITSRGMGRRSAYRVMSCQKMRSINICPDLLCPGTNPISQYHAKRRSFESGGG